MSLGWRILEWMVDHVAPWVLLAVLLPLLGIVGVVLAKTCMVIVTGRP